MKIAKDYDDLSYMSRKIVEKYKTWGTGVNIDKAQYMIIEEQEQNLTLEERQIIKHRAEYKYLSIKIVD